MANDTAGVARLAHKLKGACGTVGAESLGALAATIERAGQAGDPATLSAAVGRLEDEFQRLQEALRQPSARDATG